jgi:2-polyprenyl-6-methoxyphenol hydroxylase-like FAD-dependent oxidoreductase
MPRRACPPQPYLDLPGEHADDLLAERLISVLRALDTADLIPRRAVCLAGHAMIVIGDAAHATSPATTQGASMAIGDACVLAQCLRHIPELAHALTTYEHLRRSRVERIVQSGASGENPVPPVPGPRKGNPAESVHAHHIDWDAKIASAGAMSPAVHRSSFIQRP